jgi:hypothetical protein
VAVLEWLLDTRAEIGTWRDAGRWRAALARVDPFAAASGREMAVRALS